MKVLLTLLLSLVACLAQNPLLVVPKTASGGGGGCPSGLLVSLKADNNLTDSQNGNTFTAPSLPEQYTNGIVNQGFWFNTGYSSYITASDAADLSLGTAAKSFSFWIYSTAANAFFGILTKGDNGGGNEEYWSYIDNTGKFVFHVYDSGGVAQTVTSTATLSQNTWYHIVATYDSTNLKLYVNNGTPDSVSATSSRNMANTVWLGFSHTSGNIFSGIVDELQIYSTALSAGDVATLYNAGAGKQCP